MTSSRNRYLFVLLVCALAFAAAAAGCGGGGGGASLPDGIVAQVNGEDITQAQLDQLVNQAISSAKATGQPVSIYKKGSKGYQGLQQNGVKYLVQKAEFNQEAKKLHIVVTPVEVDARLKDLIKQYFGGSEKRYQSELKKRHVSAASVREDVRVQVLQKKVLEKVTAGIAVTEADAREYYLQNAPTYSTPQTREVRHILVKDQKLADKIYAELKGGADFAELAKKYSIDPSSKDNGGSLGPISKGQTVPEFDKVAFEIKTDVLSKPVKSQYGWHIIEATGPVKPRQVIPFAKVKASIQSELLQAKRNEAVSKWQTKLENFYKTRVAYAKGFEPPATTAAAPTSPTNTGLIPSRTG